MRIMRTPALGCTLLTVLVFLCSQLVRVQAENSELHCTQTIFDPKGGVYVEATLTACVGLMAAPTMPVSYNILYVGNLTVSNQISLNNIINVNEGACFAVLATRARLKVYVMITELHLLKSNVVNDRVYYSI